MHKDDGNSGSNESQPPSTVPRRGGGCVEMFYQYNAHGHKLRFPPSKKAQFVTALGIINKLNFTQGKPHAF